MLMKKKVIINIEGHHFRLIHFAWGNSWKSVIPVSVGMLLLILVTLVSLETCNTKPRRPNILYILADDVGFGDVSWNNPRMVTPVLQRLASQAGLIK